MPTYTLKANAILFDLDGTLIKTTKSGELAWAQFAAEYGFDLQASLKHAHGTRDIDLIRTWCGVSEPHALAAELRRFDELVVRIATGQKERGEGGFMLLPGALRILSKLESAGVAKWAIVTSCTRYLTEQALPVAGVNVPPELVCADDVVNGKPEPEPYLLGAAKLGVDITNCKSTGCRPQTAWLKLPLISHVFSPFVVLLASESRARAKLTPSGIVFEDAPTGIKAGVASGAKVVAVCTSHERGLVQDAAPHYVVNSLEQVDVTVLEDGEIEVVVDVHES